MDIKQIGVFEILKSWRYDEEERGDQVGWNTLEAQAVIQNLNDAGCTQDVVEQFLTLWEKSERDTQLGFLRRHRRFLLDGIHVEQKKLDCLDYLIYQLEKQK